MDLATKESNELAERGTWKPFADIYETNKSVIVNCDLPGVPKENIKVEIDGNQLKICAERKSEFEKKTDTSYRFERRFGKFERLINLESEIDPKSIKKDFKDGVLTVELCKTKTSEMQS